MIKTETEKTKMCAWVQICFVNMLTHKKKVGSGNENIISAKIRSIGKEPKQLLGSKNSTW